jgi:hypothetical protein
MPELEQKDSEIIDKVVDDKIKDAEWWLGGGTSNFEDWKEGQKKKDEKPKEGKPEEKKEEKKDEKPAEKPKEDEKPKT